MISQPRLCTFMYPLVMLLLGLVATSPIPLGAQSSGSTQVSEILGNLRERFSRIEDYQVDLKVSLDLPMLRMPRKEMTFTFKQPDKIRLKARGFAMVPRRGMFLSPDSLLADLEDLYVAGDTILNGHPCLILQGAQEGPDDLTLAAQVFIDRELWLVRGVTTFMENNQVFHLQTEYVEVAPGIHLPRETHLRFQLSENFLRARHFDPDEPQLPLPESEEMADVAEAKRDYLFGVNNARPEGKVIVGEASIVFSNYRVNHSIPDSYFEADDPPPD